MRNTNKTYEENGIRYSFNSKRLLMLINQKKHAIQLRNEKITKAVIMEDLANKLFVSIEAIKNWMYGYNGPSEMEQVKTLADYFDVDYHELIDKEDKEMAGTSINNMINMAQQEYTKDCVREVYREILEFIYRARDIDRELFLNAPCSPEENNDAYKAQVKAANYEMHHSFDQIVAKLERNMLDLPLSLYDKIQDFLWAELNEYIDVIADFSFWDHPGEELSDSEIQFADYISEDFFKGDYMKKLRVIFADYIVK